MGLRFRKSVKILPGVKINFNKKSTSVTIGGRGAKYTISSTGKKTKTVGIPGTGLYYTETSNEKRKSNEFVQQKQPKTYSPKTYKICGIIMILLSLLCLMIGLPTFAFGGLIFVIFAIISFCIGRFYLKTAKKIINQQPSKPPLQK
ncbi:DUF4236 domain-containing protein [Anaerostipes butyraticus]|uniref:DUF4236 domain-containing protein n=1 Tax=Anaerostipes butyraticus TaxID=645466 RepID=A0A916VCF0_9FIRM|nr:DUF4236 domain-containing protein [Anaerostipes butyraticus]GFO85119.1 hypothetical protein ANBU17_14660 [Anaerostipes butyraticus]HJC82265.1 DUF4236 domain-containing protein [Candidatus Anaerostipes avicola]